MKRVILALCALAFAGQVTGCSMTESSNPAADRMARDRDAREALELLYSTTPGAKQLASNAAGVLIFPDITKAGFLVGGQYGNGVLFRNGRVAGYYNSSAISYGLQAGVQKFGYALIFMKDSDLAYLNSSDGWEIGVGPSITVVDVGMANSFTTTTAREGVFAFFFEQRGLMAGLGIQGTKITKTGA